MVAVRGTITRRIQGEADSGVTSMDPTAKTMAKMKCAMPRMRHRHIAGPREGLQHVRFKLKGGKGKRREVILDD